MHRLTDLEPLPTIAFLVSDATPHLAGWHWYKPGPSHQHELRWQVRSLDVFELQEAVALAVVRWWGVPAAAAH